MSNMTITKQKVPNVADVVESKKQRIKASILEIIAGGKFADLGVIADEILQETSDPKIAISALLKLAFKDELNEKSYSEINEYAKNKDYYSDDRGMSGHRPIGDQRRGYVDRKGTARLFIAKGRNDNMDPRGLVEFIQRETGVDQRHIDDVKMFEDFSFFAVPFEDAEKVLHSFQKQSGGKRSLVTRAKEKK